MRRLLPYCLIFLVCSALGKPVVAADSWLQYDGHYVEATFPQGRRATRDMRLELHVPIFRAVRGPIKSNQNARFLRLFDAKGQTAEYRVADSYITTKTSVYLCLSQKSSVVLILDGAIAPGATSQSIPMNGVLLLSEGGGSVTVRGTYHVPARPKATR